MEVSAGPEPKWLVQTMRDTDLVYDGAEDIFAQTALAHSGFLDESSHTNLYARESAVLMRPGNPLRIKRLEDLTRPGLRLLDVNGPGPGHHVAPRPYRGRSRPEREAANAAQLRGG